jgi:hypothetical protein
MAADGREILQNKPGIGLKSAFQTRGGVITQSASLHTLRKSPH